MVRDQHDVPGGKGGVHRSGGIGYQQSVRPQQPQNPNRIARLCHGPALIGVEPALHYRNVLPGQPPKDKLPLVIRCGRVLHMGNLSIGDDDRVFHLIPQKAQAGA